VLYVRSRSFAGRLPVRLANLLGARQKA
jgi:hypothetical protein